MSKHTPGPWKVTDDGCIYFKDGFIGEAYQFNPGLYGEKQEDAPMMANAKLIAAAPEMLEALKDLLQYGHIGGLFHMRDSYYKARKQATNLVAKIKGDE